MLRDLLHGLRMMRRNPVYAFGAILLVALGVGANTAVFTVARAIVLGPLPFENPSRLISIWRESVQSGSSYGGSWPHLSEWKRHEHLFEGVEAYSHIGAGTESELQVTGGFFALLGVHPIKGRTFSADELAPQAATGSAGAIVVSYDFWQRRLHGRPDVVGQLVRLGDSTRTVVGVLPRDFRVFRNDLPEVFSPLRPFPGHLDDRSMTYLEVVARLLPGIDVERVRGELAAYSQRVEKEHPRTDAGFLWRADGLGDRLFGSMRPVMTVLLATAGFVLLITCANLAILLLVRAVRRRREMAIRAALGADRLRIVRQLLAESLGLALAGGAAGVLLSAWVIDFFAAYSARTGLGLPPVRIDGAVLAFALLISAGAGVFFGAAPVWRLRRVDLNADLRASGVASERSPRFSGGTIVVAEIALSTVLLIGAGLLLQSFIRASRIDPGFHSRNVITLTLGKAPLTAGFRETEAAFWSELTERARSLPGVQSAAFSGALPLAARQAPENMKGPVALAGKELPQPGFVQAEYVDVSPGYFQVMGIPLRRGRIFEDHAADGWVAIINESFAREHWGGENPIGGQIVVPRGRPYTIVGVVGDVSQYSVRSAPPKRQIYRVLSRSDVASLSKWPSQYLVVRTSVEPESLARPLEELVRSIDPDRPVIATRTMREIALRSTAWDRLKTIVVSLFGATALLLTLTGMYAVVAHSVSQRRREIGIRVAVGGRPGDIRRMVLKRGMTLATAGLAIGILTTVALTPLFSDQLFNVTVYDLPTLGGVFFLIVSVALLACYLPIRGATRLDAATVLRAE